MTDSTVTKRPASQYYWGDWFKDVALQSCSLPARGLWHEMNCLMHQGEPYGHLTMPNGKPMEPTQLGNLCKIGPALCRKLIAELEDNGVLSRAENGTIFSRRMVRDEASRELRAQIGRENGHKGAEHGAKGGEHGGKGGRPKKAETGAETPPVKPGQKPPQNPRPSSSSSSSPSGLFPEADASSSAAEPPTDESPACPHARLLALFAELVPELPQPRRELWEGSKGADAMRQRWKWLLTARRSANGTRYASTAEEGLDWFRRFFEQVAASDFLTGRNGSWRNCDLTWLMGKENFAKVVQGNYTNKDQAP